MSKQIEKLAFMISIFRWGDWVSVKLNYLATNEKIQDSQTISEWLQGPHLYVLNHCPPSSPNENF